MTDRNDGIQWHAHARVDKFDGPDADRRARAFALLAPDEEATGDLIPDDTVDADGNQLVNAGLTRITSLMTGGGGQTLTNTSSRIGVGDGSTAVAGGDTDLSAGAGGTHRQFEVMAATYPTVAVGVLTFQSVFATGEANFAWNEWGIDIGAPTVAAGTTVNATLLNRRVVSLGTKTSASAWTFTVTITLS